MNASGNTSTWAPRPAASCISAWALATVAGVSNITVAVWATAAIIFIRSPVFVQWESAVCRQTARSAAHGVPASPSEGVAHARFAATQIGM